MMLYTAPDNAFKLAGIQQGDILTIEESEPKPGDFTLLTYKGKYQLVWFIGYDFVKHPIISVNMKNTRKRYRFTVR